MNDNPPPLFDAEELKAPGPLLMLLEGRVLWEYAALIAAIPWLRRLPAGDGHPVIVLPGLGAGDLTTLPLRSFLSDRGYVPYAWNQGFNLGPHDGVLERLRTLVQEAVQQHGTRA